MKSTQTSLERLQACKKQLQISLPPEVDGELKERLVTHNNEVSRDLGSALETVGKLREVGSNLGAISGASLTKKRQKVVDAELNALRSCASLGNTKASLCNECAEFLESLFGEAEGKLSKLREKARKNLSELGLSEEYCPAFPAREAYGNSDVRWRHIVEWMPVVVAARDAFEVIESRRNSYRNQQALAEEQSLSAHVALHDRCEQLLV